MSLRKLSKEFRIQILFFQGARGNFLSIITLLFSVSSLLLPMDFLSSSPKNPRFCGGDGDRASKRLVPEISTFRAFRGQNVIFEFSAYIF